MAIIVENCPRCGANDHTFDVLSLNDKISKYHDWQGRYEAFCVCRACNQSTVFLLEQKAIWSGGVPIPTQVLLGQFDNSLNQLLNSIQYISIRDIKAKRAPEHTPQNLYQETVLMPQEQCFVYVLTLQLKI